jgi:flagellar motor switch protein FliN/FliY
MDGGTPETTGETGEAQAAAAAPPRNLDLLLDIPLEVTVEIGRTRMALRELLALAPGAVVELDKLAGEPLDVFVNGKPIARGEAVMVNDHFGVRLTDVISPSERITGLK